MIRAGRHDTARERFAAAPAQSYGREDVEHDRSVPTPSLGRVLAVIYHPHADS